MNIASLTGVEIASRVPVSSADAIAALSPDCELLHPHHNAVGLVPLLANLDEAGDRNVPGGVLEDRMRDARGLQRRNGKAGRCGRGSEQQRKRNGSRAREKCDCRNEAGKW